MKFSHKLMDNNFTDNDIKSVSRLLKKKERIFTQSKNVIEFEKKVSHLPIFLVFFFKHF